MLGIFDRGLQLFVPPVRDPEVTIHYTAPRCPRNRVVARPTAVLAPRMHEFWGMGKSIRNAAVVGLSLCVGGCGWLGGYDEGGESEEAMPMDPSEPDEPLPEPPPEDPFVGECIPSEWQPVSGPVGAPVDLELVGSEIHLEALDHAFVESVEGPGRLALSGGDVLAFGNATVDGSSEGTLVVVGSDLELDGWVLRIDAGT